MNVGDKILCVDYNNMRPIGLHGYTDSEPHHFLGTIVKFIDEHYLLVQTLNGLRTKVLKAYCQPITDKEYFVKRLAGFK